MSFVRNNLKAVVCPRTYMLLLVCKSLLVGVAAGVVVSLFRLTLAQAEHMAFALYAYVRAQPVWTMPLFVLLFLCCLLVHKLVVHNKAIGGSGIPQVKGIVLGYIQVDWLRVLLAKFAGTALSMAAGLSLGREGPSVQMGASVAQGLAKKYASSETEKRILIASGASAGLAAAFNAPLAGAVFALEEIFKYISPQVLLATMLASVAADFVSRLLCGGDPVFAFVVHPSFPLSAYWVLGVLGVVLGLLGAAYNAVLLRTQAALQRLSHFGGRLRLLAVFFTSGVLGLVFPVVLGGGSAALAQWRLSTGLLAMLGIFAAKFAFSMVSFGCGAPGGIFFPLLVLGGAMGAVAGKLSVLYLGVAPSVFESFVVFAMAGFFAAIVRAPVTGIILLLEMTGSFGNLLPFALVSALSSMVAELVGSRPIYDSLLERQLADRVPQTHENGQKIVLEMVVHHGAPAENRPVRALALPKECLLLSVQHAGREWIPHGDTVVHANDTLILLLDAKDEIPCRCALEALVNAP